MDLETALFMGDLATFERIEKLCGAAQPLLRTTDDSPFRCPPGAQIPREEFLAQRLQPTDAGEMILAGKAALENAPLDRDEWLGGVHLRSGEPMWMWNPDAGNFLLREP